MSLYTLPADRPRISQLIFFALGCLVTLAFAPLGWHLVLPLLLLPFLYVCLTLSPRDAARHSFWFGFGMFLTGTYWIYISVVVFGQAPAWIAILLMLGLVLIMSLWLWLTGWLISRLSHGEPWVLLAVAPAVWVIVEWLRGWVFTGFPWLALGYSQTDSMLAGWAPVIGVYGVSAMLVLSITALLIAMMRRGRPQWIAVGIVIVPWVIGGILKTIEWTEPEGDGLRATLIQAGIPQDQKWLPEQFRPTLDFYYSYTLGAPDSDIVVWPEVAVPSVTDLVEDYISILEGTARRANQTILFGILERTPEERGERRVYNSVIAVGGESRQVYRKRHLVPFGEYFPVPDSVRAWMRMMSLPHNDLSKGEAAQPLIRTVDGTDLAVMICYEDAYAAEQLYALPDAGLLVNVSNDAWFGESIAPHQHLQIARMRSLETGREGIRATNTGISAFIGHDGALLETGAQFEPAVMTRMLQPRRDSTPFVTGGNAPILLICLVIAAVFWLRSRAS
jgi:apolipoprotein N-acyltransferase